MSYRRMIRQLTRGIAAFSASSVNSQLADLNQPGQTSAGGRWCGPRLSALLAAGLLTFATGCTVHPGIVRQQTCPRCQGQAVAGVSAADAVARNTAVPGPAAPGTAGPLTSALARSSQSGAVVQQASAAGPADAWRQGALKPVQYTQPAPPGCAAPCSTGPLLSTVPVPVSEDAAQYGMAINPAADCARQQAILREETSQLQQQMADLERRLETEQESKQELTASLSDMNQEMNRLSDEIRYWQQETRRVEKTFSEQHQHDIAALDAIVRLVEQVPEPETEPAGNTVPQALPPVSEP